MGILRKQIGWSQESNLLWEILRQLNKLAGAIFNLKPKYKVQTALLTQSGGDVPSMVYGDAGNILVGVTYRIISNPNNFDFTPYGAPNSDINTYFVCTQQLALDENPDSALTSLSANEGAPVVTVLENTIGNIWFTYNDVGSYFANSNNLFTDLKTTVFISPLPNNLTEGYSMLGSNSNTSVQEIRTVTALGTYSNDFLYNTTIEIRVYN